MPPLDLITSPTPFYYNSWHFHNRAALPLIGDTYHGFDAEKDTFAIAELVRQLAHAQIDYVLLDQTNTWNVLLTSYQVFAREISRWNSVPGNRRVRYAIAGMFKRGPADVEKSAEYTLRDFLNHPEYGGPEYESMAAFGPSRRSSFATVSSPRSPTRDPHPCPAAFESSRAAASS